MEKRIRILLVDGYTVMREALRALITTAPDMEVVGDAADGDAALEQALRHQPDVIVLDLASLDHGGMSVIASLLKNLPQVRILILTDEINERDIKAAVDAGVKGYLAKGTAAPEILEVIRSLHCGQSIFGNRQE